MRFFFDIDDDHYSAKDGNGVDLPDVDAARQHASKVATSVAYDLFEAGGSKVVVTVRDDARSRLALSVELSLKQFPESPVG
jgi:hypothetical protein